MTPTAQALLISAATAAMLSAIGYVVYREKVKPAAEKAQAQAAQASQTAAQASDVMNQVQPIVQEASNVMNATQPFVNQGLALISGRAVGLWP